MSNLLRFLRATLVGGLFFLFPLALILVVVQKLTEVLRPIAAQVTGLFNPYGVGPGWEIAIVAGTLFSVAFLAGLFAATVAGHGLLGWLETALLGRLPGYHIVKSAAAEAADGLAHIETSKRSNAVFVRDGEFWVLGFTMDQISEDMIIVYVPDAPLPTSGSVLFVPLDQVADSGLKVADALRLLRQLGAGYGRLSQYAQSESGPYGDVTQDQ